MQTHTYIHSRLHRRWMGSHMLMFLTLVADLLGAALTFFAGGWLVPFTWSLVGWLFTILNALVRHIAACLVLDIPFVICLGSGTLLGFFLGLAVNNASDSLHARKNVIGGVITFFITMGGAFLTWIILEVFHFHRTPLTLPEWPRFPQQLSLFWALLWLFYYVLIRIAYKYAAAGQSVYLQGQSFYQLQRTSLPGSRKQETQQKEPSFQRDLVLAGQLPPASSQQALSANVPISRAHPGGPKWELLEQCYDLYKRSLQRFATPPLSLKTPDGFRYYEGGQQIYWFKHTLLLPNTWLDHKWRHALLPELARQLMYYNGPDLRVLEFLNGYPSLAKENVLFLCTLNFLWVPTLVKNIAGRRWQGERVLDADRFAYLLGEGMRLRSLFYAEQEANQRDGLVDSTFPTLDERIEHLSALMSEESKQLHALGFQWKTPQHTATRSSRPKGKKGNQNDALPHTSAEAPDSPTDAY